MQNDLVYSSPDSDSVNSLNFNRSSSFSQSPTYWEQNNTLSVFSNQANFNGMSMNYAPFSTVSNPFINPSYVPQHSPWLYNPSSTATVGSTYVNTFETPTAGSAQMYANSSPYIPNKKYSSQTSNQDCTLDIEKVRRHEDKRTTLMIRNIPNW